MPKKVEITPAVRAVLEGCTFEGNALTLPQGQLDRKLYEATDAVLKALGGKWQRGQRVHQFPSPAEPLIREALGAGHAVDVKRTLEQFFTPELVAERVADLAQIEPGMHVLEPEAGDGRLVRAALGRDATVTAVEIAERLCADLATSALAQSRHGDLFVFCADFLVWEPASRRPIDRVIMNPPFGNKADINHVLRAFRFLRPGGRLVAIMSPHWRFATAQKAQDFRDWVAEHQGVWDDLLPGTFKAEGTGVNAGILILDKPE